MKRILAAIWAGVLAFLMPTMFDGFGREIKEQSKDSNHPEHLETLKGTNMASENPDKGLMGTWLLFLVCGTFAALCGDAGWPYTSSFLAVMAIVHLTLFLIGLLA